MLNYLRSEIYRFTHKKSPYIITALTLALLVFTGYALSTATNTNGPVNFASNEFFYVMIIGTSFVMIMLAFAMSALFTGRDKDILKQTIGFGFSRPAVYWSKFGLSFVAFVLLAALLIGTSLLVGELILPRTLPLEGYLISLLNHTPMILSGLAVSHALNMNTKGIGLTPITLLILYTLIDDPALLILSRFEGGTQVMKYIPPHILDVNANNMFNGEVVHMPEAWIVGLGLTVVALIAGSILFNRRSIK